MVYPVTVVWSVTFVHESVTWPFPATALAVSEDGAAGRPVGVAVTADDARPRAVVYAATVKLYWV